MTTVITGASGHVGINLIRALLARGRKVRALAHVNRRVLDSLDVEVTDANICDPDSLRRAFEGADVVYHLAAHISLSTGDWQRCSQINIEGTRNVIEACRRSGVRRLVHFSTIHALQQEPQETPVDESRPFVESPGCPPYDRSKAAAEKIVREASATGLNAVIINPTGIMGPYDYEPSFFGAALILMANGRLPALVAGGFDWVDVRDVAGAAMLAEERAPSGASYLVSGHYVTVKDIALLVAEIMSRKAPGFVCPLPLASACAPLIAAGARLTGNRPIFTRASMNALATCNHSISHARATRDLGYEPRPFNETIRDTLAWFRENGYIHSG
ncbi:MAG: NAD-dependent epimerase/dehydratase family protein [Dehalococcoidia bacterium]|nr:NAD-dependent epimerase/dehydratase family protein [Dehalococcoidia bacterium]